MHKGLLWHDVCLFCTPKVSEMWIFYLPRKSGHRVFYLLKCLLIMIWSVKKCTVFSLFFNKGREKVRQNIFWNFAICVWYIFVYIITFVLNPINGIFSWFENSPILIYLIYFKRLYFLNYGFSKRGIIIKWVHLSCKIKATRSVNLLWLFSLF